MGATPWKFESSRPHFLAIFIFLHFSVTSAYCLAFSVPNNLLSLRGRKGLISGGARMVQEWCKNGARMVQGILCQGCYAISQ